MKRQIDAKTGRISQVCVPVLRCFVPSALLCLREVCLSMICRQTVSRNDDERKLNTTSNPRLCKSDLCVRDSLHIYSDASESV